MQASGLEHPGGWVYFLTEAELGSGIRAVHPIG